MALEIGAIVEGKITGITKFGAFVELPEGKTGMVHISEVASTYVKVIRDFVTDNQIVKVKIMAITPEGKINLSMKRAEETPATEAQRRPPNTHKRPNSGPDADARASSQPQSFEDMLSRFKQTSDDKMLDIKRNLDGKRGSGGFGKKSHSK